MSQNSKANINDLSDIPFRYIFSKISIGDRSNLRLASRKNVANDERYFTDKKEFEEKAKKYLFRYDTHGNAIKTNDGKVGYENIEFILMKLAVDVFDASSDRKISTHERDLIDAVVHYISLIPELTKKIEKYKVNILYLVVTSNLADDAMAKINEEKQILEKVNAIGFQIRPKEIIEHPLWERINNVYSALLKALIRRFPSINPSSLDEATINKYISDTNHNALQTLLWNVKRFYAVTGDDIHRLIA